jgi:hypothetical protein
MVPMTHALATGFARFPYADGVTFKNSLTPIVPTWGYRSISNWSIKRRRL